MRLIDLSQPVTHDGPNCPVHQPVVSKVVATHAKDNWHMECINLSIHTGSHLDAPLHKIAGGKSIDQIPLESFVGTAVLCDLRDSEADRPITAELLSFRITGSVADCIILLATGWGEKRSKSEEWHYHSPYLAPDGAQWLVDHEARILQMRLADFAENAVDLIDMRHTFRIDLQRAQLRIQRRDVVVADARMLL